MSPVFVCWKLASTFSQKLHFSSKLLISYFVNRTQARPIIPPHQRIEKLSTSVTNLYSSLKVKSLSWKICTQVWKSNHIATNLYSSWKFFIIMTIRGVKAGRLRACQSQVRPEPHLLSWGCHTLVSLSMNNLNNMNMIDDNWAKRVIRARILISNEEEE